MSKLTPAAVLRLFLSGQNRISISMAHQELSPVEVDELLRRAIRRHRPTRPRRPRP